MSRKKKEESKTQKGKFKNKLCFLAAAIAAGSITTEDKKLYGGEVCTVRANGVTSGNPTTLGSAPGSYAIACGDDAIANGTNSIATGKGAFTATNSSVAIGENAAATRESDIVIGKNAGLYNQGKNSKGTPGPINGFNVIIGTNAMVGDDNNTLYQTSQGIAIGGSGNARTGASKNGDNGGAWAKGDQSIAIGGDTIAEGHSSIAIGGDDLRKAAGKSVTYTHGTGQKTTTLLVAMQNLAGVAASDINAYNVTKAGSGAVALGVKSVSGDLSLAIGTMSTANKVNATAVGTAATADLDNSVAVGGGSTTANAAATQETSATINGITYSNFAGGSTTKVGDVVSIGKNGTFNRQIKNVAAGNISATSTDAVNGSQLYSVAQTLQDRFKYVSINSTETGNADNKGALATNSIAIGPNASTTVTAENAVVVGNGAKTTEQVMNPGAPTQWTKTGKNSVVIGNKATTNSEGSVAIGHEAKVDNTTGNSGSTIGRYKNDDNSTYMGTSLAQNNIYADPSYVGTQGIAIGANSYSDYQGMSMGVGARSKNLSLALGYFSNAEGTSSIATGVGAYAKGDNSISSGRQSSTISTGSVALGVAARGGSTADGGLGGSIAVGAASDATHEQAIAIGGITNANTATLEQGRGDNTQATAARATAIGANAKAQAESSIAFGTKANVGSAGTNAVAIGKDSSATIANGVALGSESKATTAAGVTGFDMADGRSNVYSGLAGTAKTANMAAVSVGDGANKTRQITGVAAGKEDTDAVNVAQLKSTNLKIAGNTTSGGADVRLHNQTLTVKGDGTYLTSTAAGNTITMELKQDVKDKIDNAATKKLDNLDPAGVQKIKDTAAWNVVANSGTPENVKGGDTVKFINGDNIEITQAGKDFTFATKKDVTFDSVTINNGPKLSSTGIDAGNKTISNVANGTANNDAVNLGQLNNAINNATATATSTEKVVASTAADNIATVAPSTGQNLGDKNATYEVSVSKTAVQNIAKDAAAWNVSTNGGTAEKVEGGDTVNFVNGDNIEVTNTGKDITIATKKDATFDSVTINNGPKLSSTGVDAGNKKITNVADGTVGAGSKDAVNGGQLHDVKTSVTNNTTALNDLKSNTIKLSGDSTSTTAERLDKNGGIEFGVKSGDTNFLTSTAAGTDITLDLAPDAKAKINKVATLSSNTVSLGGDTGTTNTQALDKTGGIKFNVKGDGTYLTSTATGDDVTLDLTQTTKDKINNAATNKLDNLDPAGVQKIKDTAAWNVVANAGTAENVKGGDTVKFLNGDNIEITQAGKDFTFATKKDVTFDSVTINNGPKLSSTGIDAGGKTISNVANGTANNDAVNLGQLNNAINNVAAGTLSTEKVVASTAADNIATVAPSTGQNLGDKNATYEVSVSKTAVQNIAKDAAAWNVSTNGGAAEKVEGGDTINFVNGDNIEVTNTGKDITIATKKDATFDSVTINNGPKLSSTGVDAGNKKITNVADGTVGAGSKDAVNGGQLHDVKTSVTNNTTALNNLKNNTVSLGGDTGTTNTQALDKTGGIKFNVKGDGTYLTSTATGDDVTLDLTQTTKDKINNAATNKLDNLDPAGVQKIKDTAAWNVVANSGTPENVKGGDTVKFINGDNIEITQAGKDFTFATKKDVTFDSVTINNGPKLSSTGVDAGNKKITNVADGTVGAGSKDAVNGGQLHDVKTSVTNNTTALNDLKSNTIKLSGDSTSTTAERLDKNGGIEFGVKSGDTNYLTSTATGTDITLDLAQTAKDKIDKVTTLASNTISLGGDTGTTNTQALDKTGGIKFNVKGDGTYLTSSATGDDVTLDLTQTTKDKINNAATNKLDNLDPTGVQKIKDTAAWNVVANSGTPENVKGGDTVKFINGDNIEITQAGKDFTFATKKDVTFDSVTINNGPKLSSTGIDAGNKKISNLADGTANNDAVNLGQLNNAINNATTTATSTEKVVASTAADNIATVAPSTGQNLGDKNATYEVSVSKTAVQNIAKDAAAWNVSTNGGTAEKVEGGDTVNFVNGDNIEVTNTGKDITIATKRDVNFDSVTVPGGAGNVVINNSGINAGNNKITNVADGTVGAGSKDAVNGGQLHDVKTSVTNNTTALNDLKSNTIKLSGDSTSTTAERLDKNGGIEFGVKSGDTNFLTSTAAGTDITLDLAQTAKDKINNAATNKLDNLDPTGVQKIKDTAAWNVVANSGTPENVKGGDTVKFINGDNIEITQAGKDFTFATKKDVTFDSVTINNGPKLSSTGIDAGGKTISNVANGTANNDAVNLGQLNNAINNVAAGTLSTEKVVASTAADNIATVAPSTGQNLGDKNATYEVSVSKTAVQNIAKDAAAWNVSTNGGAAEKVEGGDTVNFVNGDNIEVTNTGKDITIATKRDVNFDSVTVPGGAGNVVINNSGINAGNNKITNVADGTVGAGSKDAVNGGQLHDVKTSVTNNTTALNDLKSNTIKLSGDSTSTTAERLDKNGGIEFGVKSGDTNFLTSTAAGTDITLDLTQDTKDKINKVTTLSSNTISLGGDTGTTNTQALDKTGGIKFNVKGDGTYLTSNATNDDVTLDLTQTTKDKINNAATNKLDNLDPAGVQKIKDTAAWNVVANAGTAQKVEGGDTVKFIDGDNIEITQAGKDFTFATKRDVNFDSVTVPAGAGNVVINNSGINAGGNKISNVADGTANNDAVNLGQLNAVKNSPMKFGGDSGTDVDRKLGEKLNVKGGATGNLTNNNIAVEADGNDTLNIKLAENVDLGTNGRVKIGDSTLNNDGLTITGGPSITKTGGINAGGNKISNVAAGTANDDAVNVSQLNTAINNAGAAATIKYKANGGAPETVKLSDGLDFVNGSNTTATVGPNGVVKYDVNLGTLAVGADGKAGADGKTGADGTVGKDGIATTQDVAKAINSSAWKVTSTASTGTVNTPSVEDVKNGDTVKFDAGDNIEITQNGKDFTFATKKDVTFDSVTINNGGPKLNATGIDAANKKITNVADGAVTATSKDAVNGSQLYGLSKNTVTVSGDSTSTTPQTLDQTGGIKLGIKSGDTNFLTSTATGTDVTLDLTQATKDKINKVTTLSSNTISLGGDTGTTNTQALDKTGGIKFNVKGDGTYLTSNATNDDVTLDLTQATKDKINNAATNKLDNLDPAGIQKIKDTAAWNVVANNGTAEKVEGGNTVKFIDGDNIAITQAGKDFTIATKRDVNFDSVTVPAGAGNVVINNSGINAGNNKITNVADGTIAPGSKDAVNGGQLHDVQSAMNAGAFTVSANGGAKDRIAKDENVDFENTDGNIAISYDATGNKFTYNLSPNLNLGPAGSLRIGDALLNNGGLTIVNGPSITSAGVDAGNKKVTNVADGTIGAGSKDAINGGQLHDVQTNLQTSINNNAQNIANNTNAINNLNTAVNNPITFTGDSGNNIDRKLGETLNIKGGATGNLTSGNIGVEADSTTNTLNVKLAENIDLGTNGSVKMGDTKIDDNGLTINGGPSVTKAGIDAGNKKVTNVANGDITATSKDAVNGSQLHGVADSIKNSIGGNTILNPDGTITTSNIGGTGQNNIHDAISAVNSAANQKTTVVAGDNIDVTVSTNATGGNEYTVATKRDIVVDSVSVANNGPSMNSNGINAGGKTISNLGAGVNPDDAVNVAQLNAVKNSPITFGADTGTDYAATLGSKVNIVGDNKNITTSVNGNNIQVAMSDTPSFGTVNVNDANTGTITGASNVTLDNLDEDGTVGRVATEAQLSAVRNEVTAGTKDIDNKLRGFKRGADAGTASAMAMAGIPQVINPGENAIGASISAYKNQTAVAVGYTRASKNGRAVLKISGSVNSNSELGFSLGFMKGWD